MLYGLVWLSSRQAGDCVKSPNNGCFYLHIHWTCVCCHAFWRSTCLLLQEAAEAQTRRLQNKWESNMVKCKSRSLAADWKWLLVDLGGFYLRQEKAYVTLESLKLRHSSVSVTLVPTCLCIPSPHTHIHTGTSSTGRIRLVLWKHQSLSLET